MWLSYPEALSQLIRVIVLRQNFQAFYQILKTLTFFLLAFFFCTAHKREIVTQNFFFFACIVFFCNSPNPKRQTCKKA